MNNLINKKQNIFESPIITIKENSIEFGNSFININNITQVWIDAIPKNPILLEYALITGCIGLFILIFAKHILSMIFFAIAILLGIKYLGKEIFYGINIELSSGKTFYFTSNQKIFLETVYDCIKNIINEQLKGSYTFNLQSGDTNYITNNNLNTIKNANVGNIENNIYNEK